MPIIAEKNADTKLLKCKRKCVNQGKHQSKALHGYLGKKRVPVLDSEVQCYKSTIKLTTLGTTHENVNPLVPNVH